jgi:hypothetical protein
MCSSSLADFPLSSISLSERFSSQFLGKLTPSVPLVNVVQTIGMHTPPVYTTSGALNAPLVTVVDTADAAQFLLGGAWNQNQLVDSWNNQGHKSSTALEK